MKPEEVSPFPQPGQFWAKKNPLTLMRIDEVTFSSRVGSVSAVEWTPEEAEESCWIMPLPEDMIYLSSKVRLAPSNTKANPGDVWLAGGNLYFIGETKTGAVGAYTTITQYPICLDEATLYQPGPVTHGKTYWDMLDEE